LRDYPNDVLKLLLDAIANVNSKKDNGQMPLSWAIKNVHDAVVELLLTANAEADVYGGLAALLETVLFEIGVIVWTYLFS
jgi:ankyrin repeat protein